MTPDETNLLTLHEYYVIMNTSLNKPYIDEQYGCHLFDASMQADAFIGKKAYLSKTDKQSLTQKTYSTQWYSYGIRSITIHQFKEKKTVVIPITEKDCLHQYYNAETNGNLVLLSETSKAKYLYKLARAPLLAPINIEPRTPGHTPKLAYCYATGIQGDTPYYILFSTIQECTKWNEQMPQKWKPLEVNLATFGRIRKGSPVLINPLTDKIVLNDKQIQMALTGGKHGNRGNQQGAGNKQ